MRGCGPSKLFLWTLDTWVQLFVSQKTDPGSTFWVPGCIHKMLGRRCDGAGHTCDGVLRRGTQSDWFLGRRGTPSHQAKLWNPTKHHWYLTTLLFSSNNRLNRQPGRTSCCPTCNISVQVEVFSHSLEQHFVKKDNSPHTQWHGFHYPSGQTSTIPVS